MVWDTGPVVARSPALTVSHAHGKNELRLFAKPPCGADDPRPEGRVRALQWQIARRVGCVLGL